MLRTLLTTPEEPTRLDSLRRIVALEDEHEAQRTTRVIYPEADRMKVALRLTAERRISREAWDAQEAASDAYADAEASERQAHGPDPNPLDDDREVDRRARDYFRAFGG